MMFPGVDLDMNSRRMAPKVLTIEPYTSISADFVTIGARMERAIIADELLIVISYYRGKECGYSLTHYNCRFEQRSTTVA